MANDHGAPEAGQFFKAWTRDCRDRKSPESVAGPFFMVLNALANLVVELCHQQPRSVTPSPTLLLVTVFFFCGP